MIFSESDSKEKSLSYASLMNEIEKKNQMVNIKIAQIRKGSLNIQILLFFNFHLGWYRETREDGLRKLRESFLRASGEQNDPKKGLIKSLPLTLYKLPHPDDDGYVYECIDGNHRLTLFREMFVFI